MLFRALGYTSDEILDMFFDTNEILVKDGVYRMRLVPERLRGETATFDILAGDEIIVEQGRRVTARHIRQLEKANIEYLEIPADYLQGRSKEHTSELQYLMRNSYA